MLSVLEEESLLALAGQGALPERFLVRVRDQGMFPVLRRGTTVAVTRAEAATVARGDIVLIATAGRVALRRVLHVDGARVLVRGDRAPFADGWVEGVVGRVESRSLLARIAASVPEAWQRSLELASRAPGRARALIGRLTNVLRRPEEYEVRRLEASALPEIEQLFARAGVGHWSESLDASGQLGFGLRSRRHGEGRLLGTVFLSREGETRGLVRALLVVKSHRGRGGSARLLEAVREEARRQKMDRLFAYINVANLASQRVFERQEYVRTGWWTHRTDPFAAAERQWLRYELRLARG